MDVRVAGHQVDTGESLREHAIARIEELTEKYFSRAIAANVTFGRGPINDFTCDIVAPVAQGVVLKASHRAQEAQLAFNGAADRIETQLRRYVKRLREHKARRGAADYVENAGLHRFLGAAGEDEDRRQSGDHRRDTGRYSRSERVRRGDADGPSQHQRADVQEFASGDYNMIYRREDGNIGWVEPREAETPTFPIGRGCGAIRPSPRECHRCNLSEFLDFEAIKTGLPGGSKRSLAAAACAACRGSGWTLDPAAILASLVERERLGSTGFGKGVAIPHGKIEGLDASIACSRGCAEPVDYKAIDGQPVDLVFLLLSPPDAGAEHLKALAAISR